MQQIISMYTENDRPLSLENSRAIAFLANPASSGEWLPYDTNIKAQIKDSSLVHRAPTAKYAAIGCGSLPPAGWCWWLYSDFTAVVTCD